MPALFSATVEYALRSVVTLAAHDGMATAQDLAQATQSPPGYVSKVLQTLVDADIVFAKRGPKGGFRLARGPELITVLDVVDAVDPVRRIESCPLGLAEHADKLCPMHKAMDDVAAYVRETLSKHTIAQLMTQPPAGITPMQLTIGGLKSKTL